MPHAAPPLALRKGYAFPSRATPHLPHRRRREGNAFGGADEERIGAMGRKGRAFPHSGGAEPQHPP